MTTHSRYCSCPGDGIGVPCGRALEPLSGAPTPKLCVGCQIARCGSSITRRNEGSLDCPARRRGPVAREA